MPGLAPVVNPLVALRDEEKAAQANEVLLEKISEGLEVSRADQSRPTSVAKPPTDG